MNCDTQSERQERMRKATQATLMPALQTFQYVLRNFAKDVDQPLEFKLDFTVSTGEDGRTPRAALGVTCPNEFGDVCRTVTEFFQAFGGTCVNGPGSVTCELPDSLPEPLPNP